MLGQLCLVLALCCHGSSAWYQISRCAPGRLGTAHVQRSAPTVLRCKLPCASGTPVPTAAAWSWTCTWPATGAQGRTHLAQEALQALEVAHVADRAVQLRPREVLGQVVLREDLRHQELAVEGRRLGEHGCDVTRAPVAACSHDEKWEESGANAASTCPKKRIGLRPLV